VSTILFCPFCRESFEGVTVCPEHELGLVPWNELPRPARRDDEPLPWWSPALGRGEVAAGALGTLAAFATLPLATVATDTVQYGGTMLKLALLTSPKLWLVATGVLAELAMLGRRRTPLDMRKARLAVLFTALVPIAAAFWALDGARRALAASDPGATLAIGAGPIALTVCALVTCAGALRLGGPPPKS
jgi:hypothetical protein